MSKVFNSFASFCHSSTIKLRISCSFYNKITLDQIVLCTNTRPDFNAEEVASVAKDQKELFIIVEDMADHLPIEDPNKGDKI